MSLGISKLRMHTLVFWTWPDGQVYSSYALPHCGTDFMDVLKVADTSPEGISSRVLARLESKTASVLGASVVHLV